MRRQTCCMVLPTAGVYEHGYGYVHRHVCRPFRSPADLANGAGMENDGSIAQQCHNYIRHDCIGRDFTGHNYMGHSYVGHNCGGQDLMGDTYVGHNYIGYKYIGHNYIGHNYIGHKALTI